MVWRSSYAGIRRDLPFVRLLNFEGAQSAANWDNISSTGTFSVTDDPEYGLDSTNALRFTQSDASASRIVQYNLYNPSGWDCSKSNLWTMALEYAPGYVPGRHRSGNTVNMTITLSSDGDGVFTNTLLIIVLGGSGTGLQTMGRNVFSWLTSDMTPGNSINLANVTNVRIRLSTTSVDETLAIQGLWNGLRFTPAVCVTFDDGDETQGLGVNEAAAIANDYGIPLTHYIIPDLIDGSGYLSSADLDALYAAGNSIAVHGVGGKPDGTGNLTDFPDNGLASIAANQEWLRVRGFDYRHYCYPGGARNGEVIANLQSLGFLTARSLRGQSYVAGPPTVWPNRISYEGLSPCVGGIPDWFSLNATPMNNVLSLALMQAAVTTAINKSECIIPYGHKLGAVADNLTVVTSDYTSYIQFLASLRDQGFIDPMTIPQFHGRYNG